MVRNFVVNLQCQKVNRLFFSLGFAVIASPKLFYFGKIMYLCTQK